MSYFAKPRLAFWGTDAMTNPSTANNENIVHLLDYNNVELLNPPQVDGADLPTMSDAAYREWMTTLITYAPPPTHPPEPDWQPAMPAYWNYWGDHLTTFGSAAISSAWVDDAPVIDVDVDPIVGAAVVLNARIVDLDPADTYCSQLVASHFSVVGRDRHGQLTEFIRGLPTTSMTRWLNVHRYRGAGTFQAVIRNETLRIAERDEALDSPGLEALRTGAECGGGLILRWCIYGMTGAQKMPDLYERFRNGEKAANPKFGSVVGSIGVWNGTDPISAPVGRVLHQPRPPFFPAPGSVKATARPRVKSHGDVERIAPDATDRADAGSRFGENMGPAVAFVDGDEIVLDLGTAFPEGGASSPFTKQDFGPVNLEVVYEGTTHVLGRVRYDTSTYRQLGGVCAVAVTVGSPEATHISDGSLQLATEDHRVLLREIDVPVVVTDDQAVYIDLTASAASGDDRQALGFAHVRVFRKGRPSDDPTPMRVEVWADQQEPGKADSVHPLVVGATTVKDVRAGIGYDITVPSGGELDIPIHADRAGCYKLRYVPAGMNVDNAIPDFTVEYFSCFRVLPYNDYSHVDDKDITFDLVYREVFQYYAILYPVMSRFIPWGPANAAHDAERVAQFASLIKDSIDDSRRGTALEMPITRELSAGKRALLRRWCDVQLRCQ